MVKSLKKEKEMRVRFAPSPTGPLHIGSARTVLFNWLLARQNNGKFILRVDDTDIERSRPEYEKDIIEGLKWLGFNWDEGPDIGGDYGPYRQSERREIYEKYLEKLLNEDKAYYCFCSLEELEEDRKAMFSQGLAPKYSGKCRHLSPKEALSKVKKGDKAVIRFKMPAVKLEFHDLIRGKIKFDAELFGDIAIAKDLKSPLFNFAGAIDDWEMKITHIIRGEDHLSNTPKQILIQQALGFKTPKYAHLPLILAPDRSKISKRSLETSISDYRQQGYLSETIVNFLALLGWRSENNPNKEIFSIKELIEEFDIKKIQKAGAIFNLEKLEWLNAQYTKILPIKELIKKMEKFVPPDWFNNPDLIIKTVKIEKERIKKLSDFNELAGFFFKLPEYDLNLLKWQEMSNDQVLNNLKLLADEIDKIPEKDFNEEKIETVLMPFADIWGRGELFWPLRAALSGKQFSPGPFEIMEVLGKRETLNRLETAIKKLS